MLEQNFKLYNFKNMGISIVHTPSNAAAEMSPIGTVYDSLLDTTKKTSNTYFFNRLVNNHPDYQNKGVGGKLVDYLLDYCDTHNITLVCEVNAYGRLSQDQLRQFYKNHGFTELAVPIPEGLVYYPHTRRK